MIDDQPIVLEGLRHVLGATRDFYVIAEARSGEEALSTAARDHPDISILGLRLPDILAPELCAELAVAHSDTKIVVFTGFPYEVPLQQCLDRGASALILSDIECSRFLQVLREVRDGNSFIDDRLMGIFPSSGHKTQQTHNGVYGPLTPREYDVLRLVAAGMTTKEIARALKLKPNTIRSYTQSLLNKLHTRNRIKAIATARQLRLI